MWSSDAGFLGDGVLPDGSPSDASCEADSRGLVSCWGPLAGPAGPSGGSTVSLDMRQTSFADTHSRSTSSSLSSALSAFKHDNSLSSNLTYSHPSFLQIFPETLERKKNKRDEGVTWRPESLQSSRSWVVSMPKSCFVFIQMLTR